MELDTDMSDVLEAIQRQTAAIENLTALIQKELYEIKYMLSLTPIFPMRYNFSQENVGDHVQGVVLGRTNVRKKPKPPPFVPPGQSVTCVRCGYVWTPQSRTPQKCPSCRAPWWLPAKWRWHRNSDDGKES